MAQEHQDVRSSTATLDRFTSALELHQSDDARDWLLSHVRCILTQQQQDDPDQSNLSSIIQAS